MRRERQREKGEGERKGDKEYYVRVQYYEYGLLLDECYVNLRFNSNHVVRR